jgi:hypothetical protein|nr:MAG TPA: hypothetical protein [Bacteriophage sp.]
MTALEAISILDGFNLRNNADKYDVEALNMAQEAMEKFGVYSDYYETINTCPACSCGLKQAKVGTTSIVPTADKP